MVYYDDEVPDELVINQIYTAREIRLFLVQERNRDAIVVSETGTFTDDKNLRFKIIDSSERYLHRSLNGNSSDGEKLRVYVTSKT